MKILPYQIQKITQITHLKKAPQFLDLLNSIVKVEELNLPLKRNQGYVMKYFMQYRSEVRPIKIISLFHVILNLENRVGR